MLKCLSCHVVFGKPKTVLGNSGCPSCGSHNFRDLTNEEKDKFTNPFKVLDKMIKEELDSIEEGKNMPIPMETFKAIVNEKPPINHICPYCNHNNQFLIRTEIYGCEKCKNSISELDWEKVVLTDEGIKYYHLKNKGLTDFEKVGLKIGQLLNRKNRDYGNAFIDGTKFMELLFPNGIPIDKYSDVLLLIRIFDKMKRIATVKKHTDIESPFEDIAGYGMLGDSIWVK